MRVEQREILSGSFGQSHCRRLFCGLPKNEFPSSRPKHASDIAEGMSGFEVLDECERDIDLTLIVTT